MLAVIDDRNEIILASWLNKKSIECNTDSDMPIRLPDYTYVLVNRSILCNCELETEDNFY